MKTGVNTKLFNYNKGYLTTKKKSHWMNWMNIQKW